MNPSIRAFFAIDLPIETKNLLNSFIHQLQKIYKNTAIHWVPSYHLHITLRFIPELKAADIALLTKRINKIMATQKSFSMTLEKLDFFPSSQAPRVLVMNVSPHDLLAELANHINQEMAELGYTAEKRPFRAHLTLAKIKNPQIQLDLSAAPQLVIPSIDVNELVLFQSEITDETLNYIVLEKYNLNK